MTDVPQHTSEQLMHLRKNIELKSADQGPKDQTIFMQKTSDKTIKLMLMKYDTRLSNMISFDCGYFVSLICLLIQQQAIHSNLIDYNVLLIST